MNSLFFASYLGWIDYKTKLLPNKYVMSLIISSIALISVSPNSDLDQLLFSIFVSVLMFLAYLFVYFLSKKSFGLGDVKYSFALSLAPTYVFGANTTIYLHLVAFMMGGIASIFLVIFKKVSKNHAIAFGPFMSLSYFLFLVLSL